MVRQELCLHCLTEKQGGERGFGVGCVCVWGGLYLEALGCDEKYPDHCCLAHQLCFERAESGINRPGINSTWLLCSVLLKEKQGDPNGHQLPFKLLATVAAL